MHMLQAISRTGRFKWTEELLEATENLLKAADNQQPVAYFATAVCAVILLVVLVFFLRDGLWRRARSLDWEDLLREIFKAALIISIPIFCLYELGRRLLD
jgi:hypothetical protein